MHRETQGRRGRWAIILIAAALVIAGSPAVAATDKPLAWWTFDGIVDGTVLDSASGLADAIRGNFRIIRGIAGNAVKFDGYTTIVTRPAARVPQLVGAFTVEAWVAVAAFPWNWCPVVVQEKADQSGYSLEIGPLGEIGLKVYSGVTLKEVISDRHIPWKTWVHVAGTFDEKSGLAVYIDGRLAGRQPAAGPWKPALDADLLIGSVSAPRKAAFIHREYGTRPSLYSLDAALDEVKIFGRAMTEREIAAAATAYPKAPPEIPDRKLPRGPESPGRFGASYAKLSYYWEWDELWRVSDHPDIVVRFDGSPTRLVFWRGTRYSPVWVTENGLWMADQSVETWDDKEGCFEHMQDARTQYSHVRIIENTPARAVVHWRYAPVSSHGNLWNADPATNWALWIDEYYTIYPDATAVRLVSWQEGTLTRPHQFQESIPLAGPGQVQGDVINTDYVTVANIEGDRQVFSYIANPPKETAKRIPENPTVQMHHLRAKSQPFIVFEPGSRMSYLRDMNIENLAKPGSCVHWPVGQIPCDGRTGMTPDRASSFLGFPITYPVIHTAGGREWVHSLYGMTDKPFDEILVLARSWSRAPILEIRSGRFENGGFDMSQRAYVLRNGLRNVPSRVEVRIEASPRSPIRNACLVIKDWGMEGGAVRIDGRPAGRADGVRTGIVRTLEGGHLVVWIERTSERAVTIVLEPAKDTKGGGPK